MPAKEQSYWSATVPMTDYPKAEGEIHTDVAIVGGGMAGINTAYQLKQAGLRVIVLEAGRIGRGNTANTTAKITVQHAIKYKTIVQEYGEDRAALYVRANLRALQEYERIIAAHSIGCDFKKVDSYIYSTTEKGAKDNENETEAAAKAGAPADLVTSCPELPFGIINAYRVKNMAQFHPMKYLIELAKLVDGGGSAIYENSRVKEIKDDLTIYLENGVVHPTFVVIASHYPFINTPGYYFLKMYQSRSTAVAFKWDTPLNGHYNSAEQGGYSIRTQEDENGTHLIFLGGSYKTGKNEEGTSYFQQVEKAAQDFYRVPSVQYRWSAQDCFTLDHIPYIGKYSRTWKNIFVTTGFEKWGMSSSMAGALLIRDLIGGKRSRFSPLYNPHRAGALNSITVAADMTATVAANLTKSILKIAKDDLDEIYLGKAGIINYEGHRVGVYRDMDGKVYAVNASCSHLGCALAWNPDMKSWDCPCHGSRFDIHGVVLDAPAVNALDTYTISEE